MQEEYRTASIVNCIQAMRRMGVDVIIDFSIKIGSPPDVMGCLMTAVLLRDQDRFILSLPVAEVRAEPPEVFDQMVAIRAPMEPVLAQPEGLIPTFGKELLCGDDSLTLEPEWDL